MVYVFLVNNCELVEAMTPIDLLRRAQIDVKVVSLEKEIWVKTSSDIVIKADEIFDVDNITDVSAIILPGGSGVSGYSLEPRLKELILHEHNKGTLISAICAAPTYLDSIGIKFEGTVYPKVSDKLSNYVDKRVHVDKNVITGEALGSSIEFSLEIIEYLIDENTANQVAQAIYQ